jgi:hypothetical protein
MDLQLESASAADSASRPYVGRWDRLISTTNWEKGRIICEWRIALTEANAPVSELSDDAWSRRVGGVTGQHVGRLRRVHERFGDAHSQFEGLYWSHFQAALDWADAEMWLEGAIQNRWSVSAMRKARCETLDGVEPFGSGDEVIVEAESTEDFAGREDALPAVMIEGAVDMSGESGVIAEVAVPDGDAERAPPAENRDREAHSADDDQATVYPLVQPFVNLADLPEDLKDALESLKLAVLSHKADQRRQVAREAVLALIDGVKQQVTAPASSRDRAPV